MERKVYISRLLDFYGGLLPEKQQACISQYCYDDLSLSEISENLGITRQGVRDCIKRAEAALEKTESVLRLAGKYGETEERLGAFSEELTSLADKTAEPETADRLRQLAEKLIMWEVY